MTTGGRILGWAALCCVLASPAIAAPKAKPISTKYPVKSGRVVYRVTSTGAGTPVTTMTLAWDDYGRLTRQDSRIVYPSTASPAQPRGEKVATVLSSWTLYDGHFMYTALPGSTKALRLKLPQNPALQLTFLDSGNNTRTTGIQETGKVIGHATLLGKPTTIRRVTLKTSASVISTKICTWGALPLRTEVRMTFPPSVPPPGYMGKNSTWANTQTLVMSTVATSLDLKFRPPSKMFRLPAGTVTQDMNEYQKELTKLSERVQTSPQGQVGVTDVVEMTSVTPTSK